MKNLPQVRVLESVVPSVVRVLHVTLECPHCRGILGKVPGASSVATADLDDVIIKCPFCGKDVRLV